MASRSQVEEEVKKVVVDSGLTSNVAFLSFLRNPSKILHDANAMIMTSRREGTTMCALEAMVLGVPIVSTPAEGIKDVVSDEVTGFLSNDDEILANRCVDLIRDKELHRRLSLISISATGKKMDMAKYADTILSSYYK